MSDHFDYIDTIELSTVARKRQYTLPAPIEQMLDDFQKSLELKHTKGSAQSYRSLCAKCIFLKLTEDKMTSSQRSAMRKLKAWREQA